MTETIESQSADAVGTAPLWRDALRAFLHTNTRGVASLELRELAPVHSVGNAREPWSFVVEMHSSAGQTHAIRCVMLIKAEAGQLETDLQPEFHVIRALNRTDVPCPNALWIEPSGSVIGHPFFITEHVAGTVDMSLLRRPDDDPAGRAIAHDLVETAARLHSVDWQQLGLGFLPATTPEQAALAQVEHWEDVFVRNRLEPWPVLVHAFRWLREHAPVAERVTLVHGDLRVGNFVHDHEHIKALLDWEMVHLGDPIEDITWVYRSLWAPERFMSLGEFIQRYRARTGFTVDPAHVTYYRLFNEVKHAVISITASRSFCDGRTRNLRLADRAAMVNPFLLQFMEWLP